MESGKFEIPSTLEENCDGDVETTKPSVEEKFKSPKKRTLPDWLAEKPDEVKPTTSHGDTKQSKIVITKVAKVPKSNQIHYIMNDEDLVDIAKKFNKIK